MRTPRLSDERGIALAVAVFALVVIGALVAGVFFSGRLEQQTGRNTFYAAQAAEAAEAGLSDVIGYGTGSQFRAVALGGTADLGTLDLGGSAEVSRQIYRLTQNVFLVRADASRNDAGGNPLATRTVGALVRLVTANIQVNAGLTAIGNVVVNGTATVSGKDAIPPEWLASPGVDCPAPEDKAGIIFNGAVKKQGDATITGQPDTLRDATLTKENMLGGSQFDELKAAATLVLTTSSLSGLAPVTVGDPPRCDTSVQSNWGAPTNDASPCFNYFPIIYHKGDLSLSGTGAGQGILLVEGNLNAQGKIDFYGPVIVTGEVSIRGTGGTDDVKFYGGVLAQNVSLDDNRITGNATVNYSSCAIQRALQGSATVKPLNERSWTQLYN